MFTPSRLTIARKRRGLMKNKLAELVGVTGRSITAYEAGESDPSDATISALAKVLRFPPEFFSAPDIDEPVPGAASFRALTKMSASQRDAALAAGALAVELAAWVEQRFSLPAVDVPELREHEPEAAADTLRARWGLGVGPVGNMVHLLEAKGVRVFSLAEQCREVDAFSLWRDSSAYVFLNTQKSAEHGRFDAAHELGHLVLHRHGGPRGREAEQEANRFASSFLMPRASVLAVAPAFATLETLIELKRAWAVSVAALAYRLHALGLVSDWHYRSLCIEMGERGYRRAEPQGIGREMSMVYKKVFDALRAEGVTKAHLADDLHLNVQDVDALVFGLVLTDVGGGGRSGSGAGAAKLRLV
jgi:Zn-dependent peptidase ImmA (M78 family)/DNA-binding XRE family transcriptional regulator